MILEGPNSPLKLSEGEIKKYVTTIYKKVQRCLKELQLKHSSSNSDKLNSASYVTKTGVLKLNE